VLKALAIAAVFIIVLSGFLVFQPDLQNGILAGVSTAKSCERPPGYVLLVLDNAGFNNSIRRASPGAPAITLTFQKGEMVNIIVCNLDTVQAHGFAVDHYFDRGVTLRPGDAYKISFMASEVGSFTLYCNVFCTVHTFMLGKLQVV
jgi:hypothetical protein